MKNNFHLFLIFSLLFLLAITIINFSLQKQEPRTFTSKAQTPPGVLSNSNLGIFILSNYSAGAQSIVAAGPKVIKVMFDPTDNPQGNLKNIAAIAAAKDYKSKFPQGKVILRIYAPDCPDGGGKEIIGNKPCYDDYNRDPNTPPAIKATLAADHFFNNYIAPVLGTLRDRQELKYFDYIASPNEAENITDWDRPEDVKWLADFWLQLAIRTKNEFGKATCAGEIATGDVGGSNPKEVGEGVANFVETLKWLKANGGAWCYHAHASPGTEVGKRPPYTTDLTIENWYSLRYRFYYDYLNTVGLGDMPMFLSEVGPDYWGVPENGGFRENGGAQKYIEWLKWFDAEIQKDKKYILGGTIYQSGDNYWQSYNIDDRGGISSWLVGYLNANKTGGGTIQPTQPTTKIACTQAPNNGICVNRLATCIEDFPAYPITSADPKGCSGATPKCCLPSVSRPSPTSTSQTPTISPGRATSIPTTKPEVTSQPTILPSVAPGVCTEFSCTGANANVTKKLGYICPNPLNPLIGDCGNPQYFEDINACKSDDQVKKVSKPEVWCDLQDRPVSITINISMSRISYDPRNTPFVAFGYYEFGNNQKFIEITRWLVTGKDLLSTNFKKGPETVVVNNGFEWSTTTGFGFKKTHDFIGFFCYYPFGKITKEDLKCIQSTQKLNYPDNSIFNFTVDVKP